MRPIRSWLALGLLTCLVCTAPPTPPLPQRKVHELTRPAD